MIITTTTTIIKIQEFIKRLSQSLKRLEHDTKQTLVYKNTLNKLSVQKYIKQA